MTHTPIVTICPACGCDVHRERITSHGAHVRSAVLVAPDGRTRFADTCDEACMRALLTTGWRWPSRAELTAALRPRATLNAPAQTTLRP